MQDVGAQGPGTVYVFGENTIAQLGLGDTANKLVPTKVPELDNIVQATVGHVFGPFWRSPGELAPHMFCVTADSKVYAFERNGYGQLGLGYTTLRQSRASVRGLSCRPTLVPSLDGVSYVAAGADHSLCLTYSGKVYSFGMNRDGQLGHGDKLDRNSPSLIPGLDDVVQVAAGTAFSLCVTAAGETYSFGSNLRGQLGSGWDIPKPALLAG